MHGEAAVGVGAGIPAGPPGRAGAGQRSLIPTKGSTRWAGPLASEQQESPCNCVFMCSGRGFVSFCVLMYVFICVPVAAFLPILLSV